MDIKTVGIIGAGQMGAGIAQVCAQGGYDVILFDQSAEAVQGAFGRIEKGLNRLAEKDVLTADDAKAAYARLTPAAAVRELADCDLVIEAATENEATKKAIFREVCEHLKPEALLASNTSSISITKLAKDTGRSGKFIGLHFMNPVPVMKLVEIIRGIATDTDSYEVAVNFAKSLDKVTVNSEDFPAFIVNRVLIPMINEAIYTLFEGVGTIEAIDNGLKLGANHPMGPLELADFIGLDTVLAIMNVLNEGTPNGKYAPCPLLVKYVEAGWLGRKVGRGFYDYRGEKPVPTR
jgi:3-hydroxybutyryl-CoA dehydrogenase